MMGGMLAGHDQSGGQVIEKNGKKVREFAKKNSSVSGPTTKRGGGLRPYWSDHWWINFFCGFPKSKLY